MYSKEEDRKNIKSRVGGENIEKILRRTYCYLLVVSCVYDTCVYFILGMIHICIWSYLNMQNIL